jgi:hypothetical protein
MIPEPQVDCGTLRIHRVGVAGIRRHSADKITPIANIMAPTATWAVAISAALLLK